MTRFAELIGRRVVETFPTELLDTLETTEGRNAFEKVWPSIVDAYLQSLCALGPDVVQPLSQTARQAPVIHPAKG